MHQAGLPQILDETARGNISREFSQKQTHLYLLSLLRLKQEFRATVRLQVEEISQLCRAQQQSVERSLRLLQITAEEAMSAPLSGLPPLADRLRSLSQDFNLAASAYREASLVAIGPTGLAGINLIARTAQTLLDDGPDEVLNSQLNTQVQHELDRLELSRRQCGQALQPVVGPLENSLTKLLSNFLPEISNLAEDALSDLLDRADVFEAELRALERSLDLSHGPTAYGPINRLLNTADPAELQSLVLEFRAQLRTWENQLASEVGSLEDCPHFQQLRSAYESFGLLVEDLQTAARSQDTAEHGRLAELLVPQWEEVVRLQRQLEDWLQSGVSRSQPQHLQTQAQEPVQIPQTLRYLFLAVDAFTSGRHDLGQLQGELNAFAAKIPQSNQPGIQEIQAGLGYLRQLNHPGQTDLAQMGARLVWEGSLKLRAA